MIEKIISGGQTGVDRAALDVAIDLNILYGGWCPRGRIDELGAIPERYIDLEEHGESFLSEKDNYDARTKLNIRDSDGTLILVPSDPIPAHIVDGTLLTIDEVKRKGKPYLLINLSASIEDSVTECQLWMKNNEICVLNIAGPRESNSPGIYDLSHEFLHVFLADLSLHHRFSH